MTETPERIWAKPGYDSWNAYGHWYEDATGGGTEYTRADIARPMTAAEAAKVLLDAMDAEKLDRAISAADKILREKYSNQTWHSRTSIAQALSAAHRALWQGGE